MIEKYLFAPLSMRERSLLYFPITLASVLISRLSRWEGLLCVA